MGQQDVVPARGAEAEAQRGDAGFHFFFGIHIQAVRTIADGAAQAEDPHPLHPDHRVFRAEAAFRRHLQIAVVVVAPDVNDRGVGEAGEVGQVSARQIPGGEDQVHAAQGFPALFTPEPVGGFVRDGQYLHLSGLTFCSS